MADVKTIVDVEISLSVTPVPLASFQSMAFASLFATFSDRIRYYSNLTALITDGFVTSDPAYLQAQAAFQQPVPPTQIAIIRKDSTDTDWVDALTKISLVDNSWYGLCCNTNLASDIEAIAAWAESNKKLYIGLTGDVAVGTSGASVAKVLQTANYTYTKCLYHATALIATEKLDCALMAYRLTDTPGGDTWKFSKLVGMTPDTLSDTFNNFAKINNCDRFITVGGVNITVEGVQASGLFTDVRVGADWQAADMSNALFTLLLTQSGNRKIALTDNGLTAIHQQIAASLSRGIDNNFLTDNPAPIIYVPNRAALSDNDRATRNVSNITWSADLADATHSVTVRGTITA